MTIWERAPRAAVHRAPDLELVALHGSAPPRRHPESAHTQPQTRPTPATSRPSEHVVTPPTRPQHRHAFTSWPGHPNPTSNDRTRWVIRQNPR